MAVKKTTGKAPAKRARKPKGPSLSQEPVSKKYVETPVADPAPEAQPDPFTFLRSYPLGIDDLEESMYTKHIGGAGCMVRVIQTRRNDVINISTFFVPGVQPLDGELRRIM